jgi:hypothetical protein
MSLMAFALVLAGGLEVILEFGSVTFLLVSLCMAWANFRIRHRTASSTGVTLCALAGLMAGACLIMYYEFEHQPAQLVFIGGIYILLSLGAWLYSRVKQVPHG